MKEEVKIVHEHKIGFEFKNGQRATATVIFVDHNFKECTYIFQHTTYNLEEWQILGILSKKIEELVDKHEGMQFHETSS